MRIQYKCLVPIYVFPEMNCAQCAVSLFPNRIIMFSLTIPTLIYLWEIYIFPGSVCLFCCRKICGPPILGIYIINRSQTHECGNWDWGRAIPFLGTHKLYFRCSVGSSIHYISFQSKTLEFVKVKPDCCGTINCGIYIHSGRCTTGPSLIALVQWLAVTVVPPCSACTLGNRCIILRALLCFLKMTLRSRE